VSARRFALTREHLKLARRMYIEWDNCEYGAPAINPKRPYGNSASLWTPGVSDLVAESLGVTEITAECVDLLDRLQRIHDNRSVGLWPLALRSLAEEWGFDTSALSDAKAVR
jgi:hypothetical protein